MSWKFSLRDLLLATLLAALAVGWWTDRGHQRQTIAEQAGKIDKQMTRISALSLQIERMKQVLDRQGLIALPCQLGTVPRSVDTTGGDPFAPVPAESPTADSR